MIHGRALPGLGGGLLLGGGDGTRLGLGLATGEGERDGLGFTTGATDGAWATGGRIVGFGLGGGVGGDWGDLTEMVPVIADVCTPHK